MNRLLQSFLVVSALLLSTPAAYADEYVFSGQWQQVSSNAGQCSSCAIVIIRHGTLMTVTANNGWSAVIQADLRANARFAEGSGRWRENVRSAYGNSPFDIAFVLRGDQLHMRMLAKIENGKTQWIKAVFGRPLSEKEKRDLPQVFRINFSGPTHPGEPR